MGASGFIGGEPTRDRRLLTGDLWHRASLPSTSTKLKRVAVLPAVGPGRRVAPDA
ncbi:hypothetical protein MPS_2946 [Mycobacterium pseudoshottsii JCM 15466]|nr:hypothetical protein MPS_2946 [Mycobacterium pseudoshottsii JCM 15466]